MSVESGRMMVRNQKVRLEGVDKTLDIYCRKALAKGWDQVDVIVLCGVNNSSNNSKNHGQ